MASNPEVSKFRAAMLHQNGGGDIAVFRGAHRYQYGNGIGDFLRGAWKFVVPLAMRAGKTLFKVGAQAMKEGATPGEAIKNAIRPALRSVLKHGGRAIGDAILEHRTEPTPEVLPLPLPQVRTDSAADLPPLDFSAELAQSGSGHYKGKRKRRRAPSKPKFHKRKRSNHTGYNF